MEGLGVTSCKLFSMVYCGRRLQFWPDWSDMTIIVSLFLYSMLMIHSMSNTQSPLRRSCVGDWNTHQNQGREHTSLHIHRWRGIKPLLIYIFIYRRYARALQREKNNISAFSISLHTLFHVLYVNTTPDLYCRLSSFLPSLAVVVQPCVGGTTWAAAINNGRR
jgi:hypothetical protein